MKIFGDLHTHSKFSKHNHGKNTVEENIESAENMGLSFYGVSDHGIRIYAGRGVRRSGQ